MKACQQQNYFTVLYLEKSLIHRSNCFNYTIYEGVVTIDDSVVSSDTFNIVMTNRSNKHINVNNNQTMGMLRSCEEDQICTIHKFVTFEQKSVKGKEV